MGPQEDRERLISTLIDEGYLKSEKVIQAFRETPREGFISENDASFAYADYPLEIGHGQTISAPHMVAIMTELLKLRPRDNVLEIGAGSGYQAAILSRLVNRVYSIEVEGELAVFAKNNLERAGIRNVRVIMGDGGKGHPAGAPYDKIIVTCATPEIFQSWKDQLAVGGILIAPVGGFYRQELILLKKTKKGFNQENHGECIFVPLRPG